MLEHHRLVVHQLLVTQIEPDAPASRERRQRELPEEVQRPGDIVQQKLHADQVKEHADGAREVVVRFAGPPPAIADRHFRNGGPGDFGQRGNKTVQLAIKLHLLDHLPAVRLERGAKIAQRHSGKLGHHPVGHPAGKLPGQPVILALGAPAAGDIESLADFLQQRGNVSGVVLLVAVHGDDNFALREIEARFERRGLPEIAAQAQRVHAAVIFINLVQHSERLVAAAVVHEDHFVGLAQRVHHLGNAHIERQNVLLLVEKRHHQGITRGIFFAVHGQPIGLLFLWRPGPIRAAALRAPDR